MNTLPFLIALINGTHSLNWESPDTTPIVPSRLRWPFVCCTWLQVLKGVVSDMI
jgi:hypothetical protein